MGGRKKVRESGESGGEPAVVEDAHPLSVSEVPPPVVVAEVVVAEKEEMTSAAVNLLLLANTVAPALIVWIDVSCHRDSFFFR